jgi:nickel-dependent lactate racemase
MDYELGYGKETVKFHLSKEASLISYREEERKNDKEIILGAINEPIGTPRLTQLAQGKTKAVILISDRSRLAPSHTFLPYLLDELEKGGLTLSQVTIVVSLGMHRKQTEDELKELVGVNVWSKVKVINHSAMAEDCVYMGTTSRDTKVEILREVAEADLRIATGNIEPHGLAGMSGGVKALIPGVASCQTIEQNHALSQVHKTVPGQLDNPIHEDMEEAARMVPIHFLFNTIVNHRREILDAVSGDIHEAHRKLAVRAKERFVVSVPRKYDFVIASTGGFPKDLQLYQAVKTLQNASKITKQGGRILLIAKCEEGFGNGQFQFWVETMQDQEKIGAMLKEKFILGAHKVEHISSVLLQHHVGVYSDMPKALIELAGMESITNLQSCVTAYSNLGSIAIMPYGALTFPNA